MDGHFADFRVNDKQNARCRRNEENPSILQYKHLIKKTVLHREIHCCLKEMNLLPFTRNGAYTNMVK